MLVSRDCALRAEHIPNKTLRICVLVGACMHIRIVLAFLLGFQLLHCFFRLLFESLLHSLPGQRGTVLRQQQRFRFGIGSRSERVCATSLSAPSTASLQALLRVRRQVFRLSLRCGLVRRMQGILPSVRAEEHAVHLSS